MNVTPRSTPSYLVPYTTGAAENPKDTKCFGFSCCCCFALYFICLFFVVVFGVVAAHISLIGVQLV